MCFFDADPCQVYETEWRTVRKPRPCGVCGWLLPRGAPVEHHSWLFDGSWGSCDVCLGCQFLMHQFARSHGQAPSPDWFVEALHDCYEGADKTDDDAKTWRDAHAEILRRGRSSREVRA